MFCLRYFLPILLFFPFPTAPSFLLLLFLISMTTQHRPCAYCSLLLSAILLSTCSWNIASLDVSPIYPRRSHTTFKTTDQQSSTTPEERKRMNSKSNQTPSMTHESNPIKLETSFDEQTLRSEPVKAYELKSVHRCWFHSNFAKPFDPIWSADEFHSIQHSPSSPSPPPSQSSSNPQLIKEVDEEKGRIESEDQKTKSDERLPPPRRQLNTLLSPLWSPIRRLSSTKPKEDGIETNERNHQEKDEGLNGSSNPSGFTLISNQTEPQTYYRSSFSRTPLLYTYLIRHLLNFIRSYLPSLEMISRFISILNQNLPKLSKCSNLINFLNPLIPFLRIRIESSWNLWKSALDWISHPIYIGSTDLFCIRIVLGSPPPVMMSKP
ncbi:hypothetical protein DFH28DRAFT_1096546 [Melampsora americana]|nr:hypothetical protein DFH28DRAFT_1096546 [Melampsora americana]